MGKQCTLIHFAFSTNLNSNDIYLVIKRLIMILTK